jgi:hypothetical protein
VHEVEEVGAPLRDGALAELVVAIPGGILARIELLLGRVAEELGPVDVFLFDVLAEVGIPVGFVAVAALVDAHDLAEGAGFDEFAGAGDAGEAAELGADLDDAAGFLGGLGGVVGLEELGVVGVEGLLDVDVLAGFGGGLEVGGVEIGRASCRERVLHTV